MYLALTLNPFRDADLLFAQQLGIDQVVADPPAWDEPTLAACRNRIEKAGLQLVGLESLPTAMYARAILGQTDCDAAIADVHRVLDTMGRLGIPMVGYRWSPTDPRKGSTVVAGRGGASSIVYALATDRPAGGPSPDVEQPWHHLSYFLQRVIPAAEQAGVRLAYRIGGPGMYVPGGEHRPENLDELDRLFAVAPSTYHGLDLDHGSFARMPTIDPGHLIRHFGRQNRIFAVRLRQLQPTGDGLQEHFLDEDRAGLFQTLQAYHEVGFDGPLRPAPSPGMTDDTDWGHKGHAFSLGYLRALLQALG